MSDNLALTQMTAGQTNKEVTNNDGNGEIDAAVTEVLEVSVASGNVTLTNAEYRRNQFFRVVGATGSPDLARIVTLPAIKRLTCWRASPANTRPVTLSYGSPAQTIVVYPGQNAIVYTDGTATGLYQVTNEVYDFGFGVIGAPSSTQLVLGRTLIPRAITIPANFSGSYGYVGTNPSAQFVIDVRHEGVSVGTISIATNGTFTFSTSGNTPISVAASDIIEFVKLASPDITIQDIVVGIAAYLVR